MTNYFDSEDFTLYLGDCRKVLKNLNKKVDFVFADPPYFLSNDGSTIQSGKIVSVNKGNWDKLNDGSRDEFNYTWLQSVREIMNKGATIWISSTFHNIFPIYNSLKLLDFKILNIITWEKTNPPPNYSKKFFTHSSELIIWARKEDKTTHLFNYDLMRSINDCLYTQGSGTIVPGKLCPECPGCPVLKSGTLNNKKKALY